VVRRYYRKYRYQLTSMAQEGMNLIV